MRPRWNLDLLRGLLLAVPPYYLFIGIRELQFGIHPYMAVQFWGGLGVIIAFALTLLALLYPSRIRLQAVFAFFAVWALTTLFLVFMNFKASPLMRLHLFHLWKLYFPAMVNTAAAVGTWFLYRAEPMRWKP